MTTLTSHDHDHDRRAPLAALAATALVALAIWTGATSPAQAADADTRVDLLTTDQFAVLAGAGITNTGTTSIEGDIGSFPTTDQTIPGVTLDGANQGGNGVTQQAKTDLVAAYDEAAGALPQIPVGTELGGLTLVGGVYTAPVEMGLNGTLTLNGGRSDGLPSNKVFIFQTPTTLITEVGSSVSLTGGAQACNIFWQVGSAATFKTNTSFQGTVMAYTESITAQQGATFVGRLLARDAAVTLINNTITRPECVTSPAEVDDGDDDGGGPVTPPTDDDDDDTGGSGGTGGTGTDGDSDDDIRGSGTTSDASTTAYPTTPLPGTGGTSPWVPVAGALTALAGAAILGRQAQMSPTRVRLQAPGRHRS